MAPKLPKKYVPDTLSESDKKKQRKSIEEGKDRPKLDSFKSKRSTWTKQFEDKYNRKITDTSWISQNLLSKAGIDQVLAKGLGAYYTSGSRPNQTKESWAYARLASVLMNGPARNVDKSIWEKYKK